CPLPPSPSPHFTCGKHAGCRIIRLYWNLRPGRGSAGRRLHVGDLRDERAVHVRQTHVASVETERELLVIETEQMQHRRVQIVVGDRLLQRLVSELVARANHLTALYA